MAPERPSREWIALAVLAVVVAIIPILVPNPYYLNVANIIGLNTIIVVGLNLLIGYAGQISLGHAAFYGLGAYLSGILTVTYNVSPWPAMLIALVVVGIIAMAIGIPTLKLRGHYLVMATLGFNLIVNIIIIQWDEVTGGPSGFPGIPNLELGPLVFDSDRKAYYLIWTCALASMLLSLNLVHSRVGRALRALHGSEVAASSLGVPTEAYKVKIFVLSALFGSLAGSIYAHYLTFISPKTFDIFFSIEVVSMVIVGGMGNIWGALLGTVFLTSLPNVLHVFDEYKDIFYGLILTLILIFIPEGLVVGFSQRWFTKRHAARPDADEESAPRVAPARIEPVAQTSVRGASVAVERDPAEAKTLLSVQKVTMSFGGLLALSQVSFDIAEGSITSLIGPNGAGKTTLINVVAGIYRPQRGSVLFAGRGVSRMRPHRIAGLGLTRTFQNLQIFEHMTVLENVMVGMHAKTQKEFLAALFRLPGSRSEERAIEKRAWEVLSLFEMEDRAHWPASSLSFGEQKRVEMARSLAPHPRLILLDEPVAGLNMTETAEVAVLIKRIRSEGVSVLLVEHDMNLVMGVSDKVVVLNYGRKIAEGLPEEIQRDEEVLAAYLGGVSAC
jgi:branched-chain amino acid transport system permease protein